MPDSDFDAIGFEEGWDGGDIGLAVVVWEQHLGLDHAGSVDELVVSFFFHLTSIFNIASLADRKPCRLSESCDYQKCYIATKFFSKKRDGKIEMDLFVFYFCS